MTLRLDYSNMMISPGGIDQKTWASAGAKFAAAKRGFDQLRSTGSVGFVDLDRRTMDSTIRLSAESLECRTAAGA